jgi:transketolase
MSIAYPNLPVIMFGFLPGIISPGGATHQAIEDISIMRSLPNMTVLECGDATEVENVLDLAWRVKGPVYIRMLRGEIPRLFPQSEPMQLDRVRILKHGTDLAIFSSGICTEIAMQAVAELSNRGVSVEHCHISTLKPFTDPAILDSISRVKYGVVTMENHTIVGGLGTCIAEVMAENGFGKKLIKIGLKDTFVHGASRSHLMQVYGLNQGALFRAAGSLLGRELEHRADEYQEKDLKFQDKLSRAEDL